MEKKDPIEVARRYVANAEEVIKKAIFSRNSTVFKNKVYICRFFNLVSINSQNMKMSHLKWTMVLAAFLWTFAGMAQTKVTLTFQNASTQEIEVNAYGKIYFSDDYMYIDDGTALPYSFAVSDIRNMVFTEVLGVQNIETETFKVYPNPVHNELYISGNDFRPQPYQIFSADGRLLLHGESREGDPINVRTLPTGLYILKINNSSFKISKL